VVSKADASSDPIISMTVQSPNRDQLAITEYATNVLVERLQTIPGVSAVQIWGEKRYAMRIWLEPSRLNALGVTIGDVQAALTRENSELPSGKIAGSSIELSVRTFGRMNSEEDFNNLIIKNVNGADVKLKDVGEAVLGPENEETLMRGNGTPMIALAIIPLPGSNYVSISEEFYKRLEQIKKDVPSDISLNVGMDQTRFIKKSILEVRETLMIAFLLVVMIIYAFFRDWIIALRPLIDIPVSLIGAFFIMYLMGFTINVLSLLAIVLATGLVVDDGIVVTENIYKRIEKGMNKWQAAVEGSREIYFAVIATSITLAIVFLPIIFLEGFVGRLFREFGIVVSGAVLISAFVSLTLTPVLNVTLTKKDPTKHSWFYRVTEPFFRWMETTYQRQLQAFMKVRVIGLVIIALCLVSIYFVGSNLQSEIAPMEDRSQFRIQLTAPEGTSFDAMDNYVNKVTQLVLDSVPERTMLFSITSPGFTGSGNANTGFVRVSLADPSLRQRSQSELAKMINRNLPRYNEGRGFVIEEQTISVNRRGGQPVSFVVQHNNFDKLTKALPKMLEEARNSKILQNPDTDLKFNRPELKIEIDRLKAAALGVSVTDVSQALQLAFSNRRMGYFNKDGKQYSVMGQVARSDRDDPGDVRQLFVRNNKGELISLDNMISIEETNSPPTIYHFNRYKSATISAGLQPGYTIGDGIKEMERIAASALDDTFTTSLSGSSRDFKESSSNTSFAFLLALVLIFLVLAAQFESFVDPLIIMFTVPLAIAGAVLSLWAFGHTLNIFSQIGMIMLIGLVTKNGILIVEFANQMREKGLNRTEAVVTAATQRLRPILMTSLAMALGALPLALSLGAAATSRIPLGVVIVGGICFSLLLTLFVIPAMYSYLSKTRKKKEIDQFIGA
jgi:multidrug efflux pump